MLLDVLLDLIQIFKVMELVFMSFNDADFIDWTIYREELSQLCLINHIFINSFNLYAEVFRLNLDIILLLLAY